MNPDLIPREVVDATLRVNLPYFVVACVIATSGICSLIIARLRADDRLLLWFGACSILYAARLLFQNEIVRAGFDIPEAAYVPIGWSITYAVNIPFALFALELLGRGWKSTFLIWSWLAGAFACVAIPVSLLLHAPEWVSVANGLLVMGGTLLLLIHSFIERSKGNSLVSALVWPLVCFGVFVLLENSGFRIHGLSIEPIGFVVLLIGLAWVAVRHALATERRLIDVEQELRTARRIQFSILPESAPRVEGVRIASRYQPMTSVAGDFYDFQVSDELFTILVADVSGHGVPAALVACMLKVCFAAQNRHLCNPAAILSGLAEMLRGSLGGQYVTASCATINKRLQTITYAGAGHPPGVLVRGEERDAMFLDQNGLFLGPFPNAIYENLSVHFKRGDRLFLYTDGITESCNASGDEFGRENLRTFLLQSNAAEPGAVLERLFQQITTGDPQDDLTAVLVHFD